MKRKKTVLLGKSMALGSALVLEALRGIGASDTVLLQFGWKDSLYDWDQIAAYPFLHHTAATDLPDFAARYESVISKVRSLGAKPVLLTLPPMDSARFFSFISSAMDSKSRENLLGWLGGEVGVLGSRRLSYNSEIIRIANALEVPLIDVTTAFLEKKDYSSLLLSDGVNPNEPGSLLISRTISQSLSFC